MGTLFRKTPNNGYPFPPKWPLKMGTGLAASAAHPRQTTSEYPPGGGHKWPVHGPNRTHAFGTDAGPMWGPIDGCKGNYMPVSQSRTWPISKHSLWCVYVCVFVCVYVCMYVCVCVCVCVPVCCMYVYIWCVCVYVCVCVLCVCVCVCVCVGVCVCVVCMY